MSADRPVQGRQNSSEARWRNVVEADFFDLPRAHRAFLSQLPLAITTLFIGLFLYAVEPQIATSPLFVWGVIGVYVLLAASSLLHWERLPHWCSWLVPLADFIPIGAMINASNSTLNGPPMLLVFPVLWLAWSDMHPIATRIVAFVGPLLIGWAPIIFGHVELTKANFFRPLPIPFIILALAIAATVVTTNRQLQAKQLALASAEAQRRAAQLNTFIDAADVGVVVVDENGHDILMNRRQQFFHQLAMPANNPDPTEAELLVFDPDKKTLTTPLNRPVRRAVDGAEFSGALYWLGDGARQRAMATSARQITDEDGMPRGAVIVFHDVTQVVDAAAAQEDFVASVSHELRTPLTSILGYLELVMDEVHDEVAASYLQIVSRNAERLLTLVNDLMGSARDAMVVRATSDDLRSVLISAVETARPGAQEHRVTLHCDVDAKMQGSFDRGRIGQAVDNLISNAVKFSRPDGVVEVVGRSLPSELRVSVRDYGAGMSEDEQDGLFTRFYRTESARRESVPGVGLGLAITKAIVEAHGGILTVKSKQGEGSTFTFTIPTRGQ